MEDTYWDAAHEALSRERLEALQVDRLRETVRRAGRSPFYRERLKGLRPEDIRSLQDVSHLPFTTKQDLRDAYPYGFLCVDRDQLVRLHVSSGTTGQATAVFYTRHDLETWADLMARCLYMTGARPGDTFQNLTGYGLFTGGLGFHYGAERLGMLTIPSGAGNSKRQIQLMKDFQTTVLHIIPSYALRLMDVMQELGVDPKRDLSLRIAYLGAEPYSEEVRSRVEAFYGVKVFNSYGLSEMNGPGVAFECQAQNGMHIWEDAYLVEVVNPDTLEPVAEGQMGELVLTTLTRHGMPLLRYRTKDLTRILPGDCPCGRPHRRLDRIQGRSDDMFILKGVNIFPIQVEQVLMGIPEVGNNYRIVLDRQDNVDTMTVEVEVTDRIFVEDMRHLQRIRNRITKELKSELLVTPGVTLVEPHSLPKNEGKAVRLIDRRKM
ncbi:phenylacetate-CoA ligase [Desulfacinum hydrothermale DSM 13146]|uniref:Phenylacetate-coenzyme A ligase n=1 Tax=Desulfacinum hydrothermale DSM 13146 TaxID=1121390 RepID=A0A1W1XSN2_9BACT|nr:phenylacetate--CoA ligase [Desulfacinum hydrothermale]SMC26538.1 phenylacetate-CoA ligase [Desulfacinum hydrothermale DSM 13146]